jgi:hypothetical protein
MATVTTADGKGVIQTQQVALPIVPRPVAVSKDSDLTLFAPTPSTDTLSPNLISKPISVLVKTSDSSGVPTFPVVFTLLKCPTAKSGDSCSTVRLTNSAGRDTTVGVTNSTGHAQVYLRIRLSAFDNDFLFGNRTDTAIVRYEVRYPSPLPVKPDSFIIPVRFNPFGS